MSYEKVYVVEKGKIGAPIARFHESRFLRKAQIELFPGFEKMLDTLLCAYDIEETSPSYDLRYITS